MEEIITGARFNEREIVRKFRHECGEDIPERVELDYTSGGIRAPRAAMPTDINLNREEIARERWETEKEFEDFDGIKRKEVVESDREIEIADPREKTAEYAVVKMRNRKAHYDLFKSRNKVVRRTSRGHDFIDYKSINQLLGNEIVVPEHREVRR